MSSTMSSLDIKPSINQNSSWNLYFGGFYCLIVSPSSNKGKSFGEQGFDFVCHCFKRYVSVDILIHMHQTFWRLVSYDKLQNHPRQLLQQLLSKQLFLLCQVSVTNSSLAQKPRRKHFLMRVFVWVQSSHRSLFFFTLNSKLYYLFFLF